VTARVTDSAVPAGTGFRYAGGCEGSDRR
jgi:hypothetical protein